MLYVIAYDVVDDAKRQRLAELLKSYGQRVEKSVFECKLTKKELEEVQKRLVQFVDPSEDRCHIYPLCADCASRRIGLGADFEEKWGEIIIV